MVDARAVANAVLDAGDRYGLAMSNLKLQKLLFFVHGQYLIETGNPLVDGEFEAWQHGPVHPLVYASFKECGAADITERALRLDPVKRTYTPIPAVNDAIVLRYIDRVLSTLGGYTASRLRALSHKHGGPWQQTLLNANNSANIGLKIRTDTIRSTFATPSVVNVMLEDDADRGDIRESTPYT